MTNNQEMFCRHCRRITMFTLESDLLWYCDECGNVFDSIPDGFDEDDIWEEIIGEVIKCPFCNNLIEVEKLEDGYLCPICFEDLSDYFYDEFDEEE